MKHFLSVFLFLLLFTATGLASPLPFDTKGCPVPNDLNIVAPDASIDPNLACFSGAWLGRTGSQMGMLIVMERIEKGYGPTKIHTLVSWNGRYAPPGWSRQLAYYDPDSKTLWMDVVDMPVPDFRIELKILPNGVMSGKYSGRFFSTNSFDLYKKIE